MLREAERSRFLKLVRERMGMDLAGTRLLDLERGIQKALLVSQLGDIDSLYDLLRDRDAGRDALRVLMSEVTIGETHFFRNRPQFDALEQRILPDIVARRRADRRLRIWSAGCSSGEEPYSLAIALRRILPDVSTWDVTILATDIDMDAMDKARRGEYTAWSFREVPEEIESSYFIQRGRHREVLPSIRDMVTFEYLNLAEDIYPSLLTKTAAMDLIVCRNVLIYLDDMTIRRIADGFYDSLTDGGWLVVGPAEPSQTTFHRFLVHNFPRTVIYQKPYREQDAATTLNRAPSRTPIRNQKIHAAPEPIRAPAEPPTPVLSSPEPVAENRTEEATAVFQQARAHANRLEFDAALRCLTSVIELAPLLAPAHHLHGLILQEEGDLQGALEAFRRCVYADPGFALGHFGLAVLLAGMGKKGRALRALENVDRSIEGCSLEDRVDGGDGLTVKRLLELVSVQRELWR